MASLFEGIPILGDIFGGYERNKMQNAAAQNQIDWQNVWRSNAHQTEVADLKAAGLNPILSMGGAGAPMGSTQQPNFENPMKGLAQSAKEMTMMSEQIKQIKAQTENTQVDTKTKKGAAEVNELLVPMIKKFGSILGIGNSAKKPDTSIAEDLGSKAGELYQDFKQKEKTWNDIKQNKIRIKHY